MVHLPSRSTRILWNALSWSKGSYTETRSKIHPLAATDGTGDRAPNVPGLYRVTWVGGKDWGLVEKHRAAKGSKKIADLEFCFSRSVLPCALTVGRTTDIAGRLKQHMGSNTHNNRLFQRLCEVLPDHAHDKIRALVVANVKVEWVEIDSWIERSLLESYAKATQRPLFDIDAEH